MTFNPPILWGAIGGILPHIVQKAQQLVDSNAYSPLSAIIHPAYILGLAFLAVIGGIIVATFREEDSRKALFLGISAPALITAAASAPNMQDSDELRAMTHTNNTPTIEILGSVSHAINHQAYADEPASVANNEQPNAVNAENFRKQVLEQDQAPNDVGLIPRRYIEVYAANQSETFAMRFLNKQNKEIQRIQLPKKRHGLIAVPPEASTISFTRSETHSDSYPLPQNESTLNGYFVKLEGKRIYGFWSALGRPPKIEYHFQVLVKELQTTPVNTEGWAYAGKFENGVWSGKLFDFPPNQLPRQNQPYQVEYPLNLRKTPEKSAELLGQLRLNQEVRLLALKPSTENDYWVQIKVIK